MPPLSGEWETQRFDRTTDEDDDEDEGDAGESEVNDKLDMCLGRPDR